MAHEHFYIRNPIYVVTRSIHRPDREIKVRVHQCKCGDWPPSVAQEAAQEVAQEAARREASIVSDWEALCRGRHTSWHECTCGNTPENPPNGMRKSNRFWQDHSDRYDECTCAEDNYLCLLGDARHYADFSDYDMPGGGPLIRSAKGVVKTVTRHIAQTEAKL
jgi:hypothetical protein